MIPKSITIIFSLLLVLSSALELRQHSKAQHMFKRTTPGGNSVGTIFTESSQSKEIRKFVFKCGNMINAIKVVYENGEESGFIGGNRGKEKNWEIPVGEYVSKVNFKYGDMIDSIQFFTDKGTNSPVFGGKGGQSQEQIEIPAGMKIIGIWGYKGNNLQSLGFDLEQI